MAHPTLQRLAFLHLMALAGVAAEPTVGTNGWTNQPGVVEGTVTTRAVDTTQPKPPLGYLEYLPKGYDPAKKTQVWPLVIFISGLGEVGDGTDTAANHHQLFMHMTTHGPFYQIETFQWDFPAVVVAVQQPGLWNNATVLGPVITYMENRYHLDSNRIYLTGLCDGAVGVLNYAAQHAAQIAGVMAIECGAYPSGSEAAAAKKLPTWLVHCFNDTISGRLTTVAWVDQIEAADVGSSNVMATYPGYDGNPDHEALDSDAKTHAPLHPQGAAYTQDATVTKGSPWVAFKTTTYGSAEFNTWGGSDAYPYARLSIGSAAPSYTVSLGKSDGVYLTHAYTGATETVQVSVDIPVGYNTTAYVDHATKKWFWERGQPWDKTQDDLHIFTLCWYQDHEHGWRDTYSNGTCWDWLFTQVRTPTGNG